MITSEGEVVQMYLSQSDGALYEVVTSEFFGDAVCMSTASVISLCERRQLIAYKIVGQWWLRKNDIGQIKMT